MPKFQRSTNMPKVMCGYPAEYPAISEPRIPLVRVAFRNISVLKMWKFVILRKWNAMCPKRLVITIAYLLYTNRQDFLDIQ